ncbi:unnamed protein product [Closterium sp. NIES-65]|nr:unnamed protein product [Closterium sp. NIES-65]
MSKVLYSYKYVSNGFAARLTLSQVQQLRRHPQVAAVRASRRIVASTTHSPAFLNLPGTLWPANGGVQSAGEDVIIGVIDSGIWPEHPSFSDNGTQPYAAPPTRWAGRCEATKDFRQCGRKIIGARFFACCGVDSTVEYWSARDAAGHGSWCAGAAAGNNGVLVTGPTGATFGAASGMAPRARLAIYKALWKSADGSAAGETVDIEAAVDAAVADGVDVLSMSFGDLGMEATYFSDGSLLNAVQVGVVRLGGGGKWVFRGLRTPSVQVAHAVSHALRSITPPPLFSPPPPLISLFLVLSFIPLLHLLHPSSPLPHSLSPSLALLRPLSTPSLSGPLCALLQANVVLVMAGGNEGPPPTYYNYRSLTNVSPFYLTVGARYAPLSPSPPSPLPRLACPSSPLLFYPPPASPPSHALSPTAPPSSSLLAPRTWTVHTIGRQYRTQLLLGNGVAINGVGVGGTAETAAGLGIISGGQAMVDGGDVGKVRGKGGVSGKTENARVSEWRDQNAQQCFDTMLDPAKVANKVVVCDRGVTSILSKVSVVASLGGKAMVLANVAGSPTTTVELVEGATIPTLHVSLEQAGDIMDYLDSDPSGGVGERGFTMVLANVAGSPTTTVELVEGATIPTLHVSLEQAGAIMDYLLADPRREGWRGRRGGCTGCQGGREVCVCVCARVRASMGGEGVPGEGTVETEPPPPAVFFLCFSNASTLPSPPLPSPPLPSPPLPSPPLPSPPLPSPPLPSPPLPSPPSLPHRLSVMIPQPDPPPSPTATLEPAVTAAPAPAVAYFSSSSPVAEPSSTPVFSSPLLTTLAVAAEPAVTAAPAPAVAYFSSTGPVAEPSSTPRKPYPTNDILKPDIIAPGSNLWAASAGASLATKSIPVFSLLSGTSMATPHVAGIAALIVQAHPEWSPAQVMSAILTTASTSNTAGGPILNSIGQPATPWDMGAGHVNPAGVLDPGLTFDASYTDYLSFLSGQGGKVSMKSLGLGKAAPKGLKAIAGYNLNRPTISVSRLQKTVTVIRFVKNVAGVSSTYTARVVPPANVKVVVKPLVLVVGAGKTANFTVQFTVTKASQEFSFGSLFWEDGAGHVVRSVLAVQPIKK